MDDSPYPNISFLNFQSYQSCLFHVKIGRHGTPKMLILIPILVFWICKPKFVFGQVWIEKIRVIYFAWKLVPRYRHWYRQCWFWFQHWSYEFSILDLFLGEFRTKMSKLTILPENWHTWYLQNADSYSDISFLNFQS